MTRSPSATATGPLPCSLLRRSQFFSPVLQLQFDPLLKIRAGVRMSTRTYNHLHDDDQAWFVADSFAWLVAHDRSEPMRVQKPHLCFVCRSTIPAGEALPPRARRHRPHQRKGP